MDSGRVSSIPWDRVQEGRPEVGREGDGEGEVPIQ